MVESSVTLQGAGDEELRAKFAGGFACCLSGVPAALEQWPDGGPCQQAQVPEAPDVRPSQRLTIAASGAESELRLRPDRPSIVSGGSPKLVLLDDCSPLAL